MKAENKVANRLIETGKYWYIKFDHAYRFNGIIDISHKKGSIFNLVDKKWYYFNTDDEKFDFMTNVLDTNPENKTIRMGALKAQLKNGK